MRKEVPDFGNPMMAKSSIQDMSWRTFPCLSRRSLSGGMVVVLLSLDLVAVVISFMDVVDLLVSMLLLVLYTDDGRSSKCRPQRNVMVRMKK